MKVATEPQSVAELLPQVRSCTRCHTAPRRQPPLPHKPRPVLQLSQYAPILIAGQAPGTRVHRSGRPFTDPSGDRLRSWLGLNEQVFYDCNRLAIVPMGFCFPGLDAKGGDLPPRRECAATWHDRLFAGRPPFALKLVIGRYARDYHLPQHRTERLTDTIRRQLVDPEAAVSGGAVLLPHPSWRNNAWLKRNPEFEQLLLPVIKRRVHDLLASR